MSTEMRVPFRFPERRRAVLVAQHGEAAVAWMEAAYDHAIAQTFAKRPSRGAVPRGLLTSTESA